MDWQTIAMALGGLVAVLAGIVYGQIAGSLARVADTLAEIAIIVHGHGIRLDYIDGVSHEKP